MAQHIHMIQYIVLPARKHHQPRDKEDNSEDDKQRVTRPRPAGIVKHLSRLFKEKDKSPF